VSNSSQGVGVGGVSRRVDVAELAARVGCEVALEHYHAPIDNGLQNTGGEGLTQADRDTQYRIIEVIRESYPSDPIVANVENARKVVPAEGPSWVVAPVDGTIDFGRELPFWTISVAAVMDGDPVAAANVLPGLNATYVAGPAGSRVDGQSIGVSTVSALEKAAIGVGDWWDLDPNATDTGIFPALAGTFADVRRFGSSQATLTYLASGALDAVVSTDTSPWRTVAGVHLVRQAGGVVTDLDGAPWHPGHDTLVASNGQQHEAICEFVGNYRSP
jgi:myo-inositol-1(or 4)-monophosphatase